MRQIFRSSMLFAFVLAGAACAGETGETGGDTAGETATQEGAAATDTAAGAGAMDQTAAGAPSMPDWMTVDEAAQTVTLDITAGATDANNYWNFNGHFNGDATIMVPQGYTVTINFTNSDPNLAHSLGIDEPMASYPATWSSVEPVFEGALTPNPTDMAAATQPNESATVEFTADAAGEYVMVCYTPGHATTGMWIHFNVTEDGTSGVVTGSA